MSSENGHKLRFEAADLEFIEQAEAAEAAAPYADLASFQTYSLAAMVWVLKKREDPTFTYEQALHMKFSDLDVVGADDVGKALENSSGTPAPSSAAPGESTPAT